MPLPESNLTLTELQKAILIKWIAQGAPYKPHWAFIRPQEYPVLTTTLSGMSYSELDRFVAHKLKEKGLQPSKRASKLALARSAALDITGMLPSKSLLDAFLREKSPLGYSVYLDSLLLSAACAERLANEWCDVARYADSHGYQDDNDSEMWPWRDWVIQAFKENKPYNQFITEQIARDLLPNATQQQVLATAFNRNPPTIS